MLLLTLYTQHSVTVCVSVGTPVALLNESDIVLYHVMHIQ